MRFSATIMVVLILANAFSSCRTQRKISEQRDPVCIRGNSTFKCSGIDDFESLKMNEGVLGDEAKYDGIKLVFNHSLRKFCSGIFIKPQIMIAPAHCFVTKTKDNNHVFLVKISNISKQRDIKFNILAAPRKLVINPAYKRAVERYGSKSIKASIFDLAVLIFNQKIVKKAQTFAPNSFSNSGTYEWLGHGLPGIWSTSDLWKRRSQARLVEPSYEPGLIEVDYPFRNTSQMFAQRANHPAISGSVLLSGRNVFGMLVGYSFRRYAFFFRKDHRLFFVNLDNSTNREFIKDTISEYLLVKPF